jgi:hypothetical protein
MGSLPEDLSTAGTAGKFTVSNPDISRNVVPNGVAGNVFEDPVTQRTSDAVPYSRFQVHLFEHLSQLGFQILSGDQHRPKTIPLRKLAVPGEEYPAVLNRPANELAIIHVPKVERVIADDAQPFGQTTQHHIGQKSLRVGV